MLISGGKLMETQNFPLPRSRDMNDFKVRMLLFFDILFKMKIQSKGKFIFLWNIAFNSVTRKGIYSNLKKLTFSYRGINFVVDNKGGLGPISVWRYEPSVCDFMRRINGGVFIDIGANCGDYTLNFARKFKVVEAIEPGSDAFEMLERNLSINDIPNVILRKVAVTDKPGDVKLYKSKETVNWSIKHESDDFELVDGITLKELISKYNQVDVLKIDVEGAESEVIKGAEDYITKVRYVLIEVRNVYEEEITLTLNNFGFTKYILERRGKESNILYVNEGS